MENYQDSCYLSKDKLILNGKQYMVGLTSNLGELKEIFNLSETCKKKNEIHWGSMKFPLIWVIFMCHHYHWLY